MPASVKAVWLVILLQALVCAQNVGIRSKLGFACFSGGLAYNFTCPAEHLPFICHCSNDDYLSTVLDCINRHAANADEHLPAYHYVQSQCAKWGGRNMNYLQLQEIYYAGRSNLIPASNTADGKPNHGTVIIAEDVYEHELNAAADMKYRYNIGNYFGYAIVGFWLFVFALASVKNMINNYFPSVKTLLGNRAMNWMRKYVTVPSMYGSRHQAGYKVLRFYDVLIPTRWQSIIILGFLIINVLSLTIGLDLQDNSPLVFENNFDKRLRYMSNRTGIIAIVYTPLVVLMACRNNPFIRLTGWSYPTMQMFHRWNARAMAVHAIVHGVLITWFSMREHVLLFKWHHIFNWRAGNTALYAMIIMLVIALRPIRRRIYEFFLISHQVLFLVFIIALAVHVSDYGWSGWLYSGIAIYCLEYLQRFFNVIQSGGISEGKFTVVSNDTFRVRIYGRHLWQIRHGNYAYLRILRKDMLWQSHPFSVFRAHKDHELNTIDLMIKARKGATRSIMKHLQACEHQEDHFKVMVEGPYGHVRNLKPYKSILLLAAGVGITAVYSYMNTMPGQRTNLIWVVQDNSSLRAFEDELEFLCELQDTATITIYVTKPNESSMASPRCLTPPHTITMSPSESSWQDQLSLSQKCDEKTSTNVAIVDHYETNESGHGHTDHNSCHSELYSSGATIKSYHRQTNDDVRVSSSAWSRLSELPLRNFVKTGRPNIGDHVAAWIESSSGPLAVFSCGPCEFVDSTRQSIVDNVTRNSQSVSYYEEAFNW